MQSHKGMPYHALRKTITINLLDFVLFPSREDFHTTGQLRGMYKNGSSVTDIVKLTGLDVT
jgi:hypothetical protein